MKKIGMLLTMLVLAAMVLAACGGQETSTNVPSTNVPSTSESTATEAPTATEMPTEVGAATETPGVPVTGGVNPARLSNELDFGVWNQNGDQIGEVDDMVLDLDNNQVSYVVVGTGGFLGIGEKEVFVPWDSLQLQTGTGDNTGGQQNAFIFQGDMNAFENAPNFDVNNVPGLGQPAGDWDADIRNFWQSGGTAAATAAPGMTATSAATEMATATGAATEAATATTAAGMAPGATATKLQGVALASDVLGSTVTLGNQGTGTATGQALATATMAAGGAAATAVDTPTVVAGAGTATAVPATGTEVGAAVGNVTATIDDALIDTTSGDIMYFVLDTTTDTGQRLVPAPLGAFSWDANTQGFVLNTDAATLQNAPSFQNDQYPDTSMPDWDTQFHDFWQNIVP